MTISRANPNGWKFGDTLTSVQANIIDTNTTYGLDKRSGQSDTLGSNIVVTGNMSIATGASWNISNPSSVYISSGTLVTGAQINGDSTQNDPLRFGYQQVPITSTLQTLTSLQSNTFVIQFTGNLTGDTTVLLPAISGYTKVIDNQTTGNNFAFTVSTPVVGSTGSILINPGKQVMVYCDGAKLNYAGTNAPNTVINLFNVHEISSPASVVSSTSGTVTGLAGVYGTTFTNVQIGDIFDITWRGAIYASSGTAIAYIDAATGNFQNGESGQLFETTLSTTATSVDAPSGIPGLFNTTITTTSTTAVGLFLVLGSNATILSPLSLTIKQIRP